MKANNRNEGIKARLIESLTKGQIREALERLGYPVDMHKKPLPECRKEIEQYSYNQIVNNIPKKPKA